MLSKKSFQKFLWAAVFILLAAYLVWEAAWYTQVGLCIIKWHTHCVEYVYVWLLGLGLFRLLTKSGVSEKAKNIFLVFSSLVITLGSVEIGFQITGTTKTYLEKASGEYTSHYSPQDKGWYHVWPIGISHIIKKPEYSYWRPTNSERVGDYEWNRNTRKNELRIMALGDSFTEGDGAPYDSSYVTLLKKMLNAQGNSFYVMNAGVLGSDPFFNYVQLRDRLLVYKPDVILQALSTQDLTTDLLLRGGMERFKPNGKLKFTKGPWWEPIYAVSYISRLFFNVAGYNDLLLKGEPQPEEINLMNIKIIDLFKRYSLLCRQNHSRLIIILRPLHNEIEQNKYDYDFSTILNAIAGQAEVVDLLPAYCEHIKKSNTRVTDYYWKTDGHHNSAGYELMAKCVYENIAPLLKDSSLAK